MERITNKPNTYVKILGTMLLSVTLIQGVTTFTCLQVQYLEYSSLTVALDEPDRAGKQLGQGWRK